MVMTARAFTPEQDQEIVEAYANGRSLRQLAQDFGTSVTPVVSALDRHQIARNIGRPPRVFTEAEVRALRDEYDEGATLSALGAAHGLSYDVVRRTVEQLGEVRRGRYSREEQTEVRRRWEVGETQLDLAEALGCDPSTISRILTVAGVPPNRMRTRELHHSWSGGRHASDKGYVRVTPSLDDPVGQAMKGSTGYVLEHRLVMAHHLGRPLRSDETVHHKDSDRANNALDNLQLRHGQHGKGGALRCADCGSHNLVPVDLPTDTVTL